MTRRTYTWYTVLVKLFVGLATLMALTIMVICTYDMVQAMQDTSLEAKIEHELILIEKTNSDGYVANGHKYKMPDANKYTAERLDANKTEASGGLTKYHGATTYRTIWILCLVSGVILGFVQLVSSIGIVCSCNPDIPGKVKTWLIINIFVFLLALLCLIVPLSYNPEKGSHFNTDEFSDYVKKKFNELTSARKLEEYHKNLFYYGLGANEVLLLVSMILIGGLLKCGTTHYADMGY